MKWIFLAGAIFSEVSGTMYMRASAASRGKTRIVAIVLAYALAFGLLAGALASGMPVGVAYGTWAAAGISISAVVAWWLFSEAMNLVMILGLALVAVGVLLIQLGSAKGG